MFDFEMIRKQIQIQFSFMCGNDAAICMFSVQHKIHFEHCSHFLNQYFRLHQLLFDLINIVYYSYLVCIDIDTE